MLSTTGQSTKKKVHRDIYPELHSKSNTAELWIFCLHSAPAARQQEKEAIKVWRMCCLGGSGLCGLVASGLEDLVQAALQQSPQKKPIFWAGYLLSAKRFEAV